jgi:hypothetical protein
VAGVILLALVLALSSCTPAEEENTERDAPPTEETEQWADTTPETTTIDESTKEETVVVTPAPEPVDAQPPVPPSVPPPPAKELPATGAPVNPYQNCHTPGSGCENIESQVEAQWQARQAQPRQITPEQQANRDRLAELQRNGTGTGDSPWVAHQKEIMAAK